MSQRNDRLPRFARARVEKAAPQGQVALIQVRPQRLAPPVAVQSWVLGSDADHSGSAERAVTLLQHEHLGVIESLLGRPVHFEQTRRNLAIRQFNLEVARGAVLQVGETLLQITGRCHPCARMDEALGPGGFAAMFGHGGWTASIVRAGTIRRGDVVELARVEDDGLRHR